MGGQRSEVVGVVVHVVTVAGLRGASVPAPVMGDDAVAVLEEEQHLGVPVVGRQRPAMAEDDRLARAPVLVEDLRAVGRGDRGHALPPLVWALTPKHRIAPMQSCRFAGAGCREPARRDRRSNCSSTSSMCSRSGSSRTTSLSTSIWRPAPIRFIMALAVVYAWYMAAWGTNRFDPDRLAVRRAADRADVRQPAHVRRGRRRVRRSRLALRDGLPASLQVGRAAFLIVALRGRALGGHFVNDLVWELGTGALWVAGAIADGDARLVLWGLAVAATYAGVASLHWLPGRGRRHRPRAHRDRGRASHRALPVGTTT